ncbi:hypothetical protein Asi02nite_62720 [Asanoa siamensis]|uniref:Uncharacterized protein n=1 Tax=Asanoa siamensis TaxID=926357 RepID=A0ABQ4CZN4_9ACTN|nr:hypothetical protein Asi02nite_62720 [Asanoa siamensis]
MVEVDEEVAIDLTVVTEEQQLTVLGQSQADIRSPDRRALDGRKETEWSDAVPFWPRHPPRHERVATEPAHHEPIGVVTCAQMKGGEQQPVPDSGHLGRQHGPGLCEMLVID